MNEKQEEETARTSINVLVTTRDVLNERRLVDGETYDSIVMRMVNSNKSEERLKRQVERLLEKQGKKIRKV